MGRHLGSCGWPSRRLPPARRPAPPLTESRAWPRSTSDSGAGFDAADAERRGRAGRRRWRRALLAGGGLWWQIQLDARARRSMTGSRRKAVAASEAATDGQIASPSAAKRGSTWGRRPAPGCNGGCFARERLAAARDAKKIKDRSSARWRSTRPFTTRASASASTGPCRRRAGGGKNPALAAAAARRRRRKASTTCCCRQRGALLRGEADYQLHWIYFWYEEQPQRGLAVLQDLHARYPTTRSSPSALPRSRTSTSTTCRPALPPGRTSSSRPRPGGCTRRRSRAHGHSSVRLHGSTTSTKQTARSISRRR